MHPDFRFDYSSTFLETVIKRFFSFIIKFRLFPRSAYRVSCDSLRNFLKKYPSSCNWSIGDWSYGEPEIIGDTQAILTVGNFVSIAPNVKIFLGHEHNIDWVSTYPFSAAIEFFSNARYISGHPSTKGDVIIGSDVWIADSATILSGVTIGDGAVIGNKTLVTKNVPPYAVVAGIPAKVIKYRFIETQIEALLKIKWWNWDIQKIDSNLKYMSSASLVEEFIKRNH